MVHNLSGQAMFCAQNTAMQHANSLLGATCMVPPEAAVILTPRRELLLEQPPWRPVFQPQAAAVVGEARYKVASGNSGGVVAPASADYWPCQGQWCKLLRCRLPQITVQAGALQ